MAVRPAPSTSPDEATDAWTAMYEFVAAQDRRKILADELDLGPGRVDLLLLLGGGPMTPGEIAEALHIDAPSTTVTVDKLVARGLVRRTPHPDDNRRKLVHVTAAGRRAAEAGHRILTEPPAELTELSRSDLAALHRILGKLAPTELSR